MKENIVIVGAGIAGLTLAERLTASGRDAVITVMEREGSPGGLARTFSRDGFFFDIGPHRFHTQDPLVSSYILEILGDEHVTITRSSNVFMAGKYRKWPLTLGSISGLPLPVLFRSFLDLFRKGGKGEIRNFADHVISRYGNNIYQYFFRDYTEKFTGCKAEELHLDWAEAGVNRAVIDKNVKADNLFSLMKGLLIPKPVSTVFYYPAKGGIQTFCDIQASLIEERGGRILTGCPALGIESSGGRMKGVRTVDGMVEADRVYWSAPVSILFPDSGFRFMDTLLCNIGFDGRQNNDYQWCYFGDRDILFSRLTVPANFRSDSVPDGRDSLIAEITMTDAIAAMDGKVLERKLIDDLEK